MSIIRKLIWESGGEGPDLPPVVPPAESISLREDGGNALREDGDLELEEGG